MNLGAKKPVNPVDSSATESAKQTLPDAEVDSQAADSNNVSNSVSNKLGFSWWLATVIFGLLYVWFFWQGLSSAIVFPRQLAQQGISISAFAWLNLAINMAAPITVYLILVFMTRKQNRLKVWLSYLLGLAVIATIYTSVMYALSSSY